MTELNRQVDELRFHAQKLHNLANGQVNQGFPARAELLEAADAMRDAMDTIISLRDRLHELQGVGGKSRYSELFGTPERAARTLERITIVCHTFAICDTCSQEYCIDDDYDALLEWLKGGDEVIGEPDTIRNELTDSGLLRGDA